MSERKHESDSNRAFALLYELARYVINGSEMVRVHSVPQAKAAGEKCYSKKHGMGWKVVTAHSHALALNANAVFTRVMHPVELVQARFTLRYSFGR